MPIVEFQLKNLVKMRDSTIVQSSVCAVFLKKSTDFTIGVARSILVLSPLSLALSLPGVAGTAAEFQLQTCGCIGRRVCQSDREQSLFSWKYDELRGLGESGGRTSEK